MKDYHSISVENILSELDSKKNGLAANEAEKRLNENGPNALEGAKKITLLHRFLSQFKNVMILVLIAAAIISFAFSEAVDAIIILTIVILNAIIGVVQESKAEKSLDALKNMSKPFSKVMRNNNILKIKSEEIVIGDIIILEAGDYVPADLRLIESASLKIQESALTGESIPVDKSIDIINKPGVQIGDRTNMAYSSSIVTYGRGMGIVIATGMDTEVGKIANYINDSSMDTQTPLSRQINKTGKIISVAVLIAAAIILVTGLLQGREFVTMFLTAVSIAVAAIPEGLMAIVTVVLAIGVQKMSAKKAIIRKLPAVETLGCTQIICSDKTGTLTLNQMTVKEIFTMSNSKKELEMILRTMHLCNDAKMSVKDNKPILIGDPTETALITYATENGIDKEELEKDYPRLNEIPFDSDRKLMTTFHNMDGNYKSLIKGAPDILLSKCNRILDGDSTRPITKKDIDAINSKNSQMAEKALRVLAFAYNEYDSMPDDINPDAIEHDLIFVGIEGMIDPPREEVKDAIKVCNKAGMRAVMITGDHKDTACAIAKELGIIKDNSQAMTGQDIDKLSEDELFNIVEKYSVYARVSPEHKVRIVTAWKKHNKIVAMTGDGVNDAPSLKAADIGIGMGITGTDVAKSVSDMVLADDNFATIIIAVEEGRKTYANIIKAVQFLLSANTAEVLALFIATFLKWPFLFPVQILWINLITDSLPALALGLENAEDDIMNKKPRNSTKSLFSGELGRIIILQGIAQATITIGIYAYAQSKFGNSDISITMAFLTLGLIQLFHIFNVRSISKSIFNKKFFSNKFLFLAILLSAFLQVIVVLIPGLRIIFKTVALTANQWIIVIISSFMIIPLVELIKLVKRIIKKKK